MRKKEELEQLLYYFRNYQTQIYAFMEKSNKITLYFLKDPTLQYFRTKEELFDYIKKNQIQDVSMIQNIGRQDWLEIIKNYPVKEVQKQENFTTIYGEKKPNIRYYQKQLKK